MGKVEGNVIKDEKNEYIKLVKVQWWVLVNKGSILDEQHLYENCYNGKWKCNLIDPKQWLNISAILLSFLVQKNTTNKSQINIHAIYVGRVKVNFNVANASTNLWRMLVTLMKLHLQFSMSFVSLYWLDYCFKSFLQFLWTIWFNKLIICWNLFMYILEN